MYSYGTRHVVFRVGASDGRPEAQPAELSGMGFEGKRHLLTGNVERTSTPYTWHKGDPTLTAA
jgi:hypothetical protein